MRIRWFRGRRARVAMAWAVVGCSVMTGSTTSAAAARSLVSAAPSSVTAGENLARRPGVVARQAPESTEWPVRPASLAIDGNTDGVLARGSVTQTGTFPRPTENPYLEIDLGAVYPIERVVVWNRTDCCSERLREFTVLISDRPLDGTVTTTNLGRDGVAHRNVMSTPGPSVEVPLRATGRYVRIHQRRNNPLNLAEVQVIASGLPMTGLPPEVTADGLSNRAEAMAVSVADPASTGEVFLPREAAEVWALASAGTRTFVGGRFRTVVDNATGVRSARPWLIAVDRSGNVDPAFEPRLSGAVSDLRLLPDGRLLAAGAFRSVAGSTVHRGAVMLNPSTGAPDPTWAVRVFGGSNVVLDTDVEGPWVYLVGGFATVSGGPGAGVTVQGYSGIARVRLSDGVPDATWKPKPMGANTLVTGVDATVARVHATGFFSSIDGVPGTGYVAWLDPVTGRPVSGVAPHATVGWKFQHWDVVAAPSAVYELGAVHEAQATDPMTKVDGRIHTAWHLPYQSSLGGDMQSGTLAGGYLYVTCHCLGSTLFWNLSQAQVAAASNNPDTPRQPLAGVWRARSADFTPDFDFAPELWFSSAGQGGWATSVDADGCVWVGGDLREVRLRSTGRRTAQGGFTRLCPLDASPPPAPGRFVATRSDASTVAVSWSSVVDDRPGRSYELLLDGRVVATTASTSYTLTGVPVGSTLAVRAVDRRGNRSATAPPVSP